MQKPPRERWPEQKVVLPETQEAYQEKESASTEKDHGMDSADFSDPDRNQDSG